MTDNPALTITRGRHTQYAAVREDPRLPAVGHPAHSANSVRGDARRRWLEVADGRLACLRALLRLAYDLELLGGTQVKYAAERVDELGRLLGAWKKGTDR
jgi:hypothetical protein